MSTETKNFINKYYNEFGDRCPFKRTEMVGDTKELEKEFAPQLEPDITLLEKFFKATIKQLLQKGYFTANEKERLIYLDHYWDIPKINFIYTQGYNLTFTNIFDTAVRYSNLEIMEWLLEKGCSWDRWTFASAAKHGNLDIMKWLLEKGCPWDEQTFEKAAEHGNLENMEWLLEKGCPWDEQTFASAAKNSNLDNMKWLLENKCPWDYETFWYAAEHGNLENMKWLLKNKCPWNEFVPHYAAENGHLNALKWLLKKGCPWDECSFSYSSLLRNQKEIMKWLQKNNYMKRIPCLDPK